MDVCQIKDKYLISTLVDILKLNNIELVGWNKYKMTNFPPFLTYGRIMKMRYLSFSISKHQSLYTNSKCLQPNHNMYLLVIKMDV